MQDICVIPAAQDGDHLTNFQVDQMYLHDYQSLLFVSVIYKEAYLSVVLALMIHTLVPSCLTIWPYVKASIILALSTLGKEGNRLERLDQI